MVSTEEAYLIVAAADAIGALASVISVVILIYNTFGIRAIHIATNSMKDDLVEAVRKESNLSGITEGRRLEKQDHRKDK